MSHEVGQQVEDSKLERETVSEGKGAMCWTCTKWQKLLLSLKLYPAHIAGPSYSGPFLVWPVSNLGHLAVWLRLSELDKLTHFGKASICAAGL